MRWVILILGIISNASASVLVKMAIMPPRSLPSFNEPIHALSNWPFWLGILCYGLAFLLYATALGRLPLNIAHPLLTAGAITTVAVCSAVIFKEPFYWTTWLGILLVIFGVILITFRVAR
jgi:multidrug transporter EmrE-like cation transporter